MQRQTCLSTIYGIFMYVMMLCIYACPAPPPMAKYLFIYAPLVKVCVVVVQVPPVYVAL